MVNTFFEITSEDFQTVAEAHGVTLTDEKAAELATLDQATEDRLLNGIGNLIDLDDQTTAVYNKIETLMMEQGVIPEGEHKFTLGDDDDLDDLDDLDDDDEFDEDEDEDDEFDDDGDEDDLDDDDDEE